MKTFPSTLDLLPINDTTFSARTVAENFRRIEEWIKTFPIQPAAPQDDSTATTVAEMAADFNAYLQKARTAGQVLE